MKRFIIVVIMILAASLLLFAAHFAFAAPFLVCNPEAFIPIAGDTLSYNVISGNAVCSASGVPVACCTGNGTGTCGAFPTALTTTNIPPDPTGTFAFAFDIATVPAGSYVATAVACLNDPVQGQACSGPSSPFTFSRIGPPPILTGLGLSIKQ
jgi:hypothetical protein